MTGPVVAVVPASRDSHKNSETRAGLQPVVDFAEATLAAVIGITHFTKGTTGKDPIERITGSLAFGALPRLVMGTAKEFSRWPPAHLCPRYGFGYDLVPEPIYEHPDIVATRVVWLEELEGSARELLATAEAPEDGKPTKIEQAKQLLQEILAKGEHAQTEIMERAKAEGISEKTMRRAKDELHVNSHKIGKAGWFWFL